MGNPKKNQDSPRKQSKQESRKNSKMQPDNPWAHTRFKISCAANVQGHQKEELLGARRRLMK